jgi:protein ImuB
MLWLALHLPLLSLEAFCATLDAPRRAGPVALLDGHRIAAVNDAAAQHGVPPGAKRATALALAPELVLGQADAARDACALQAVAHVALAFTPAVALHGGRTVLMELQSCLRYWGGLPALLARLRMALSPLGHRVQTAAAPTALGAALLAVWNPAGHGELTQGAHVGRPDALRTLLDAAPAALLGAGCEHRETLQTMGLHTLADLRALPRAGLVRRFGAGLLDTLDRARGERPDPRRWLALPAVFESRLELFARADSTAQVLHGAAVLLARLVAWAQARQARVAAFTLHMQHEPRRHDGGVPHTALRIELAAPSADAAHLQSLLRERLARVQLAAPTLELRLDCRELKHAPAPNGELFASRQGEAEGLLRLLERLRARLGDAQVQRLQPLPDHRPEQADRALPAVAAVPVVGQSMPRRRAQADGLQPPHPGPQEDKPLPLHRPVWLLPEPQPLPERQSLPLHEGRPLRLLSGPERIEAGWWDGAPAVRDYFIAQDEGGALLWIYRARLPSAASDSGWFLHGRFG